MNNVGMKCVIVYGVVLAYVVSYGVVWCLVALLCVVLWLCVLLRVVWYCIVWYGIDQHVVCVLYCTVVGYIVLN